MTFRLATEAARQNLPGFPEDRFLQEITFNEIRQDVELLLNGGFNLQYVMATILEKYWYDIDKGSLKRLKFILTTALHYPSVFQSVRRETLQALYALPALFLPESEGRNAEAMRVLREAAVEAAIDLRIEDQDFLSQYGIVPAQEGRGGVMYASAQAFMDQFDPDQTIPVALLNGGAFVVQNMGMDRAFYIEAGSTNGTDTGGLTINGKDELALRRLVQLNDGKRVLIIDDVVDSASSLVGIISTILSAKQGLMTNKQGLELWERLNSLALELGQLIVINNEQIRVFKISGNDLLREEIEAAKRRIRFLLAELLVCVKSDPINIDVLMGANKLLDQRDYTGLTVLADSSANHLETGELLAFDQLPWLMGWGLDTKVCIGGLNISVGRHLKSLFALRSDVPVREDLVGANGVQRIEALVKEVLREYFRYDPEAEREV